VTGVLAVHVALRARTSRDASPAAARVDARHVAWARVMEQVGFGVVGFLAHPLARLPGDPKRELLLPAALAAVLGCQGRSKSAPLAPVEKWGLPDLAGLRLG
jgi:hypothetical protein